MEKLHIKLKKLEEEAVIPTYAHDGDVGLMLNMMKKRIYTSITLVLPLNPILT